MDQTLFALPILPGKTETARAFLREMDGPRKPRVQELTCADLSTPPPGPPSEILADLQV